MKVIKSKLVIFLGLPLIFLFVVDSFPILKEFEGICTRVLDGDTVIVAGKRIRLANIDAPESSQLSYDGENIGQLSTKYLSQLILGKRVRVQFYGKGRYGRIIGTIFYNGEVNFQMIREGMAMAYGYSKDIKYSSVEYEARLLRKGIFGTFGFDRPRFYRRKMKYAIK